MAAGIKGGRAWIELDRGGLRHNVSVLSALLPPGCALMPAVKADAYGHGAVLIAGELNRLGIRAFCVASAAEGAELREAGIAGDILVLGYTAPEELGLLARYDLIQTVVDAEYAGLLESFGQTLRVHLKLDTGMRRLGERCEPPDRLVSVFRCRNLSVEGVYTHLCAAEGRTARERDFTEAQAALFYRTAAALDRQGCACGKLHLLASGGLLHYPELGGAYARTGIALYGLSGRRPGPEEQRPDLRPVLSLKARVALVKELRPGEPVGYGPGPAADYPRRLAVLSIGYADGLPRSLSDGGGCVLLPGGRAPILGKVCMDQTMVDVTGLPGVKQGDTATVIGRCGGEELTAIALAEAAGTIPNEIVSRLGKRLPRLLV